MTTPSRWLAACLGLLAGTAIVSSGCKARQDEMRDEWGRARFEDLDRGVRPREGGGVPGSHPGPTTIGPLPEDRPRVTPPYPELPRAPLRDPIERDPSERGPTDHGAMRLDRPPRPAGEPTPSSR